MLQSSMGYRAVHHIEAAETHTVLATFQPLQPGCVFTNRQAPSGPKLWTELEDPLTARRPKLELPEPPCSPGLHEDGKGVPGDTCSCRPCRALHAVHGGSQQSA